MKTTRGAIAFLAMSLAVRTFGEAVFSSSTVSNLTDAAGWGGAVPEPGEDVVISGAQTIAVLSPAMPGFASYSLTDGATLIAVPEQTIPSLMLGAGTKLAVDSSMVVQTYPGHIPGPGNKVLVGWMRPECSISEIRDIAGHISGTTWNKSLQGTPYGYVTNIVLKSDSLLECQFQNYNKPVDQDYTKGVIVEFSKDSSGNIYANVAENGARYYNGNKIGSDLWSGNKGTIAPAPDQTGYGVQNISFAAPGFIGGKKVVAVDSLISAGGVVDVAEGYILDLSGASVLTEEKLVKTGKGVIVFGAVLPSSLEIAEGVLAVQLGVEYDMSAIEFGEGAEVKVVINEEICDAKASQRPDGKTIYMLSYTYAGSGSWNDLSNWEGGALPGATDTAYVVGTGSTLAIDDADAVMPKEIVVMDGATLKVDVAVDLPQIKLIGTGALVLATDTDWNPDRFSFSAAGENVPSLTIASGAKLSVSGGTKFGGVKMSVFGTVAVTNTGDVVFGYAAAGKTSPFSLLIDGGTVTNEFGNIDFACPDMNGAVTAAGGEPWIIRNATLMPDYNYGGFNFGYNNPISEYIKINVDGTDLTYIRNNAIRYDSGHGVFYLSGGVEVVFGDGSRMYKKFAGDAGVKQHTRFNVNGRGKLVFNEGSQLLWDAGSDGASVASGYFCLEPEEDGFESLVVNNAQFYYYRLKCNGKAVLRLNGAIYSGRKVTWNHLMPFQSVSGPQLKGVVLEGTNVYERIESGSRSEEIVPQSVSFSGSGGLRIAMSEKKLPLSVTIKSGANTATGVLTADDGCIAILEDGAYWAGIVDYSDNVKINEWNGYDASELTVGGLFLKKPLVYRIWEGKNDKINFTGAGIVPNGHEVRIALQEGFSPSFGMAFDLGTVPADFDLSSIINNNGRWAFSLVDIEGDENRKMLQVSVASDVDYAFNGGSGETKVVNLSDPAGWKGGVVPVGQEVSIDGVEAIVEGDAPQFASITLKNGAVLVVRKPALESEEEETYAGTVLPVLRLFTGAGLRVESGAVVTVSGELLTFISDGERLASIDVAPGATLNVLGGTKFKNCAIYLEGTLASTTDGGIVFGHALPDETARFSMFATNATIVSFHGAANATKNASRIDFASPEVGGKVVVDAPVELVSTKVTIHEYDGFALGLNNPSDVAFKVIADNTRLDYGAETVIAGGANLVLTNNATLYHIRNSTADKSAEAVKYSLIVKEFGRITLVDGGSIKQPICTYMNDYEGGVILNPAEAGWAGIEVLDGGVAEWRKINGKKTAEGEAWSPAGSVTFADSTLRIGCGYWWAWTSGHDDLLYALGAVEIQDAKTMTLQGIPQTFADNGSPQNLRFVLDSPFTGSGNVIIANTRSDQTMQPVVMSAENTNTGTIEALLPENGNRQSYLYFQNGANWAGTVVANGRMQIVDKVEGSTYTHNGPVSVSFGALDLQSDFPIKVWKENGRVVGNDTLDVGEYLNNGGRLVPENAEIGAEFEIGDSIVVGKIAKGSESPRLPAGWIPIRESIEGDGDFDRLVIKKGRGFQLIVR